MLLLRAGTGRRIGTALLADTRVQATLDQAVIASGMLGGLLGCLCLSSVVVGSVGSPMFESARWSSPSLEMEKTKCLSVF